MKKYAIWIILGGLILWGISLYNGLVGLRESVNKSWANVETQYQRRADLIPNLVNTVKGAAEFEKSTLEAVIQARASATSIKIDANDMTPEKLQQFQAAQSQLTGALSRLLAVAENYPQLKAIQNFQELQAQLEGTENRITESRRQYNEAAQTYNTSRLKFPRVLLANLLGFKDQPYFESDKGSEKAPEVKF
ncbi:MAG TPA: LemA family protein [Bacteroidia bacterium]|nr:LemA family protein [Bacteroidia bacterium]HNS11668.1 LemA family protein [Bacteroidia bacterium]